MADDTGTGAGLSALLGALQNGDTRAFNEMVREFDLRFGLDKDKFANDVRQFNQNFGTTQAGVTGYYNAAAPAQGVFVRSADNPGRIGQVGQGGAINWFATPQDYQAAGGRPDWTGIQTIQPGALTANQQQFVQAPTMQMQQQQYAQQMQTQQQQYAQQMGMINQAATLQANPFRQQQAIGQMGNLLGGQGVAGFSAPNTVQGVGTAGGNTRGGMGYLQQMIDDIRDPSANQASMNNVLDAIPTPNKINSNEFLRAAPSTQSMVLQGMQEKYGLDPNDALAQIKATLPQFQAPTTFGATKR